MQISRSFLVACAAVCTTTLAVRASDTPEQIKAREAMRQKMLESQPPPAAPSVTPVDSEAAAKAREAVRQAPPAAPAPVVVTSDAPVPPPAPPVQQADSDSIARARAAMRQKIDETTAAAPAAAVAAPVAAPPPAPAAPPPVVIIPPPAATAAAAPAAMQPSSTPADSASIARAREAVRQTIDQGSDVGPVADSASIAKARESVRQRMQSITYADPTSLGGNSAAMNFPPLEGPPLPISADKHARLDELLQRYKQDQVTPEQYQVERAKILAGP